MADVPRRSSPWPLLAILLLVGLLTAFLVLQWTKRDAEKVTYKPPPTPPVEPVPPPVEPPPPVPVQDPAKEEFEKQVALAKKALGAGKWDEADAALSAAAKAKDSPELQPLREAAVKGRKDEAASRAEELARQEARRKQAEAFATLQEKVEKFRTESGWDAAVAALEGFAKDFPEAPKDSVYERLLVRFRRFREEADGAFTSFMAQARELAADGKHAPALTQAGKALDLYPERDALVKKFRDAVQEARLLKEMIRIPEAACWVGSEAVPDERPLRQVRLPAFFMDRYEVTNEDYAAFVSATQHPAPTHWGGQARRPPKGRERHPVVFVAYEDAAKYAAWAGKRLPTSEEWEVAARGPDQREFPWGNAFTDKENVFHANSLEYWQYHKSQNPGTMPVEQLDGPNSESAFRVLGMGGNVWEWTSTVQAEFRVLKGGSFMTSKAALRCANVYPENPKLTHPDVGFRCARDPK